MRRRVEESDTVPPPELINYPLWCRSRGLRPYGDPGNPETMRAAVAQWDDWEEQRREWADAHGVDEGDLGGTVSAPFDIDLI
jgi:hypothetical protein